MKKEQEPQAQPLELSDDELIEVMANYEIGGLVVEDEDPSKRYFFAASGDDKVRPDGVERIKQLGYTVSRKKHNSVDCTLMEIDRSRWERMQKLKHGRRIKARSEKMNQMRSDIGDAFVRLDR